ncbi:hypothetical protein ATKI12_7821 [Kitasatospora sp. Ki12]
MPFMLPRLSGPVGMPEAMDVRSVGPIVRLDEPGAMGSL